MKKLLIVIVLAAAVAAGWYGYRRWNSGDSAGGGQGETQRILYSHCPMHPEYHSDRQGDCPICGMRLQPVYENPPAVKPAASGHVHISPERQQLIGVRLGEAVMESAGRTIRVVGRVSLDETRVVKIHPRVEGWIEGVQADFLGQHVRKGQPLLTLYSPELLATQQEYLLALKAKEIMSHSSMESMRGDSDTLVQAARRRLELWDLSEGQIQAVERNRKPSATITLYAPASGYVIARNAYDKQKVTPETELFTVADLSRVWVMAGIFEADIPLISMGQPARVLLAFPSTRTFPAKVDYIQPSLDPATRTLQVRLTLDNPHTLLKPEMFVNVEFAVGAARRLMVPASAVLDSGLARTVFVDRGDGYFEPRRVQTGERTDDKVEIVSGLSAGERIVVSGTFMVDSESQLKAAMAGMKRDDQHSH